MSAREFAEQLAAEFEAQAEKHRLKERDGRIAGQHADADWHAAKAHAYEEAARHVRLRLEREERREKFAALVTL